MIKKQVFIIGLIFNISILFLSLGYASYSTTLSIDNIEVAIKQEKDIRITNFYPVESTSNISSYNVDSVHTKLYLPNPDSKVTYKVDVTNISPYALQIENIDVFPSNITYELTDYELNENLCDNNKLSNECNQGVKKSFYITFKYKENGYDISNQTGEYLVDAKFTWGFNFRVDFYSNYQDNNLIDQTTTQLIPYDTSFPLALNSFIKPGYKFSKWTTDPSGTGLSYRDGSFVKDLSTNGRIINLYAQWRLPQTNLYYPGQCIFNGKGNDIEGECSENQSIDYVNTGIKLFDEENYRKNFMLSFTITDVDNERFSSGERDTIVNALYEGNDKIAGRYPGFLLRIENDKWQLQGGNGRVAATKIYFSKDELIGKEFKIIRYNDGETIKLYYLLDGNGPYLINDISNLYAYFDTPLTFGANILTDNLTSDRHSISTVNDIKFEFLDDDLSLNEIIYGPTPSDEITTVFAYNGPCIFNGQNINITGDSCQDYSTTNIINTNVNLFDQDNYQKDFILSFDVSNYNNSQQEDSQVTLMNAFRERQGLGYGMLIRKANNNIQFLLRDGNGKEKNITISPNTFSTIKIIRNDNLLCYSLNNEKLKFAINYSNFAEPFDVPVTFGGSINKTNDPFRFIKGTISNMNIQIGEINDPDLSCPTS